MPTIATGVLVGPIVPISNPTITTGVLVGATITLGSVYVTLTTGVYIAGRWNANSGSIASGRYRR